MAEIHILPTSLDLASLSQAFDALRRYFEADHDLGDRGHHIQMLGSSLKAARRDLGRQIAVIRELSPMPGVDTGVLCGALDAWARALATCAETINQVDLGCRK